MDLTAYLSALLWCLFRMTLDLERLGLELDVLKPKKSKDEVRGAAESPLSRM